jgi:hypothetical protein
VLCDSKCGKQVRTFDDQPSAQPDGLDWKLTDRQRSVCSAAADPERRWNDRVERERRWK